VFSFTDKAGRAWNVELTLTHARRIKAEQKVCLLTAPDDQLRQLLAADTAIAVLWIAIEHNARERNVTFDDWCDQITGQVLPEALTTLWSAVSDFFQHDPTLLRRWGTIVLQSAEQPETNPTPPTNPSAPARPGTESTGSPAPSAATGDP
jgi:hypothetical protein